MSLRNAIGFSMLDKYLSQVLAILTTLVMARILTPAETGLYVVGQAVILLAENFRDFGVGAYLVQTPVIERNTVRSAFLLTLLLSLAMALAIFAFSTEIANFYGTSALGPVLMVALIGFFIMPFGTPGIALLRRDMAFRNLAIINIAVALVNALVTVCLGVLGYGAISYIWGYVVSNAVLVLLAFAARPQLWIFMPSFAGMRPLLHFGLTSSAVTVANMAWDLLPRLLFGRMLGLDAAGLFSRAMTVCQLPDRMIVAGVQPVLLPAMAEQLRQGQDIKATYLQGHRLMSSLQWPGLLMLALLADPVVAILLGPQWGEAPSLVRLLALATMALAPAFLTFPTLVATGHIRDALVSTLIALPPSVAILYFATQHGLVMAVASMLLIAPLQMLVALYFIRRAIHLTGAEFVRASWQSLAVAICTAVIPGCIILLSGNGFALTWPQTGLCVIAGAIGWAFGLHVSDHPLKAEILKIIGRRRNHAAAEINI